MPQHPRLNGTPGYSLTPHQRRTASSMQMPIHPTWSDIAVRLLMTLIAGAVIGFNREARGHAAGLRTTILVGLAAAVSMIKANVLLTVEDKTTDSFAVIDLISLPLGILTGVGFIGAGAILRRGDLIIGVTTAATLWIMSVIGLCLGGGQLALGSSRDHSRAGRATDTTTTAQSRAPTGAPHAIGEPSGIDTPTVQKA